MENLNQIIAANLKELRKKKGLSLEQDYSVPYLHQQKHVKPVGKEAR